MQVLANLLLLLGACGLVAMQVFSTDDALWAWSLGLGAGCLVVGGALELYLVRTRPRTDGAGP